MSLKGWKVEASGDPASWQQAQAGKVPARVAKEPAVSAAEKRCPACGTEAPSFARFCPTCGRSFEERLAGVEGSIQPYVAPGPPAPPPQADQWMPGQAASYHMMPEQKVHVKSPRLAMFLAVVPGLLMFMGLGHFYTRRWIKGVVLLTVGFFLAGMAYVSLGVLLGSAGGIELAASLMVAAIFWTPFLSLLAWSAVDAFKAAKTINAGRA